MQIQKSKSSGADCGHLETSQKMVGPSRPLLTHWQFLGGFSQLGSVDWYQSHFEKLASNPSCGKQIGCESASTDLREALPVQV